MEPRKLGAVLRLLLVTIVVATAAASCSGSEPEGVPGAVALPSNGWRPGQFGLSALMTGPFHAEMTAHGACAWIGETRLPFLWPEGYRVRFQPTVLLAPDGHVIAQEGETVSAGGGGYPAPKATECAAVNEWTFSVMGSVDRA